MSNERPSKKEALEILSRMAQDINSGLLDGPLIYPELVTLILE